MRKTTRIKFMIRPAFRHLYGPAHRALRARLIAETGNHCAKCKGRFQDAWLTLAHLSHDPRDRRHVAILCFTCHGFYDSPHRLALIRRNRARRTGQLWLYPAIEFDHDPAWCVAAEFRQYALFEEAA
jgi:hypothetical protein